MLRELVSHKPSDGGLVIGVWVLVGGGLGADSADQFGWVHGLHQLEKGQRRRDER